MVVIEATTQDYMDYGVLVGFMYMLGATDSFPENHDPHIILGRCQVYEAVMAALGNAAVGPGCAKVHAQILAYTDKRRAYAIAALGGKRGDMGVLWDELAAQMKVVNREMTLLGVRMGIYRRKEIAP
jgi:hypothetical protein